MVVSESIPVLVIALITIGGILPTAMQTFL